MLAAEPPDWRKILPVACEIGAAQHLPSCDECRAVQVLRPLRAGCVGLVAGWLLDVRPCMPYICRRRAATFP